MPTTHRHWTRAITALALSLFALTACTSPSPEPPPTPTTKPPVFANEEEALAAVTATFERYQELSYTILSEGGLNPERLVEVTTPEAAEVEYAGYRTAAERGYTVSGLPAIHALTLDFWLPKPDPLAVLARAEICIDISDVQVVDSDGNSVVAPDRADLSRWSVDFSHRAEDDALVVSTKDLLEGACK